MKKFIFLCILFSSVNLLAEKKAALTGAELIQKSIDISTPKTMISVAKQIVYFYTGRKREFKIKSWSKDGNDKMLMVYLKPARVKGDKFLFLKGGDIWVYFAKTGRIRRIASSAKKSKMRGSDFSYEDISMMSSLVKNFKSKIIKEAKVDGNKCYVVELKPKKNNNISYNKLIAYIDKSDFVLRKLDFYKQNKLNKYLIQSDFKKIGDYFIAEKTVMKSVKNDTKTEMFIDDLKINVTIQDRKFNKNYLSR